MWTVIALRAVGEEPPCRVRPGDPLCAGEGRRLPVAPWWKARLERHGGRDPGASGGGRRYRQRVDPAGGRRTACVSRIATAASALTKGREPDAQSTAWAIQALLSAGEKPGKAPFRFLSRLRRGDGSYRYSVRYGATPVWVTAQVISGAHRTPFPFR